MRTSTFTRDRTAAAKVNKQALPAFNKPGAGYVNFMSDTMNKMADSIKDTVDNVRDSVNESSHRTQARAEQEKRNLAGDQMTTGEKTESLFNQGKNTVQAEVDKTKRDLRNNS